MKNGTTKTVELRREQPCLQAIQQDMSILFNTDE